MQRHGLLNVYDRHSPFMFGLITMKVLILVMSLKSCPYWAPVSLVHIIGLVSEGSDTGPLWYSCILSLTLSLKLLFYVTSSSKFRASLTLSCGKF